MTPPLAPIEHRPTYLATRETDNDEQVVKLWLHGRGRHTVRAYQADARRFMTAIPKLLRSVSLPDLQDFADGLKGSAATRGRTLSSIKSLLAFAHRLGYLPFDVGRPLRLPKRRDTLSERILSEAQVQRMLALETNPRDAILVRLLYAAGLRVSELCGLRWRDCQARGGDAGQISVYGKGGKTRIVLLPASVWTELTAIRAAAAVEDTPVFLSREGGHLDPSQVHRIVRQAARRARIKEWARVSPHWLRHAHASHAIDRGAPVSLVQSTLGHASLQTTGRYLHARPNASSATFLAV
jgi:integrase/recombinase XerD